MKKLSLFLVVFLVLASFAFAQEEEAAASPLTATGSLSFSLGDSKAFEDTTTDLPIFSSTKAATATLGLATADEKVSGSVSVNLLAPVSVTSTLDDVDPYDTYIDEVAGTDVYATVDEYQTWIALGWWVDLWNGLDDATTAVDEATLWANTTANDDGADLGTASALAAELLETLNDPAGLTDDPRTIAKLDGDNIVLYTPVGSSATAGDEEFTWTADLGTTNTVVDQVNQAITEFQNQLSAAILDALNDIIKEGSANLYVEAPTGDQTPLFSGVNPVSDADPDNAGSVTQTVTGTTVEEIEELTDNDRALVAQAIGLEDDLDNLSDGSGFNSTITNTVSQTFVTSATLSLNQIGGVVDATFLFGGQHVSAGSINVDGSGHTSTAVKAYHGMTLGLSSGVVEGANASLGLYIDDNGVAAQKTQTFYNWPDESADPTDPVYGMTLGGGYSTSFGDLTAGGNLAFGLYDLLGEPAWAVSVMPSVSGMGGSADIEIAYGLDLLYTKAALSYAIMGITPTATIHYINEMDGNSLAYSASPASVLAELKNAGGFGADLGLGADLGQFLPVPASVNAGLDLGFPTGGEMAMAWSAGLSVTPLTGLTAAASFSGDEVAGNFLSDINWSTSLTYAYGVAKVTASVGQSYSATAGATSSWSIGTSVSF